MKVLIFLDGLGTITGVDNYVVDFKKGDTILIPAAYTGAIHFTQETYYLKVSL